MEVVIAPVAELARLAADAIERLLRGAARTPCSAWRPGRARSRCTTSWPAGTPSTGLSFARARAFMLDEYVGLPADHPERYRNVIETELVVARRLRAGRRAGPGRPRRRTCRRRARRTSEAIARRRRRRPAAPRHRHRRARRVQRAGLVARVAHPHQDAHAPDARGQRPVLRRRRRRRCRSTASPRASATIMSARHLVLLATGRGKAEAVHQLVEGPVSALWPAHDPAAPPARDGAGRRRRGEPPAAGRLLPRDVRVEAGLAGSLRPASDGHGEQRVDRDEQVRRPTTANPGMSQAASTSAPHVAAPASRPGRRRAR